jgi:signal transduction histidine kinase
MVATAFVSRDTAMKHVGDELDKLREELQRAQDALQQRDALLAVVAHELRNPIAPVLLSLEALLMEVNNAATVDRAHVIRRLEQTRRYAQRLRTDLDRLLDFSRLRGGHLDLRPRDTDLSERVVACLEDMTPMLAAAQCDVHTQLQRPLPGFWDPMRLDQVIWNLISNAVKYAAGARIDVTTRADDSHATLIIADHGPGIPPDQHAAVFTKFERVAPRMHHTGFGIGLWLVRNIVETMGGTIALTSEVGRGTTFSIRLPRRPT